MHTYSAKFDFGAKNNTTQYNTTWHANPTERVHTSLSNYEVYYKILLDLVITVDATVVTTSAGALATEDTERAQSKN